jgi:hypothetical protein
VTHSSLRSFFSLFHWHTVPDAISGCPVKPVSIVLVPAKAFIQSQKVTTVIIPGWYLLYAIIVILPGSFVMACAFNAVTEPEGTIDFTPI